LAKRLNRTERPGESKVSSARTDAFRFTSNSTGFVALDIKRMRIPTVTLELQHQGYSQLFMIEPGSFAESYLEVISRNEANLVSSSGCIANAGARDNHRSIFAFAPVRGSGQCSAGGISISRAGSCSRKRSQALTVRGHGGTLAFNVIAIRRSQTVSTWSADI
jgi:hypothetical protein